MAKRKQTNLTAAVDFGAGQTPIGRRSVFWSLGEELTDHTPRTGSRIYPSGVSISVAPLQASEVPLLLTAYWHLQEGNPLNSVGRFLPFRRFLSKKKAFPLSHRVLFREHFCLAFSPSAP